MSFLFGSAEADRAFGLTVALMSIGGLTVGYVIYRVVLCLARAITVRRIDARARRVWR
jgi:hypothetical protein